MNRLNRKVEYALMGLKIMAQKRPGELTSAKEIVEVTGSPFDATARVLQQLAQKKILRSEHGAHGGYVVIRDLSKVSMYELMEMILGPMTVAKCIGEEHTACELRGSCNIVSPVSILNRRVVEFYQGLSVGELLRLKERQEEYSEVGP